jgi:hypothetical protein
MKRLKTPTPVPSPPPPTIHPPPASPSHQTSPQPPNLLGTTSELRPWQVKALQAGRTPLPEAASQTLEKPATARQVVSFPAGIRHNRTVKAYLAQRRHRETEGGPRTLWKQEELDLLYELKTGGATWEEITVRE